MNSSEYFFFVMVMSCILRPSMGQSQRVHHAGAIPMVTDVLIIVKTVKAVLAREGAY
ncbi:MULTISPECIES: hypothetical protein [unclassified Rhodococcus (in: high G+C Gram-positive bacteria)]|uniref:hypothetical protein n=1 Tax=Rhodococcus sp. SJ-3 TaxID=3454628 RepID=UPI003F7B2F58